MGHALVQSQADSTILWGVGQYDAVLDTVFHAELRQALEPADGLQFQCETPGWSVAVTGYVLTN